MSELIIKISAETKEFEEAVDGIKKQTEGLESQLNSLAKISGVAFAGLVASAGIAVKAFAESEAASRDLELALQNQGIASTELLNRYKSLADQIQKKTGIDDDSIIKGEAILQSFLGQTEASEGLVQALADLSIKAGNVDTAASDLGRAIAGNTRTLKQYGITIDDSLTKQERIAKITEVITQRYGGLAESANKGLGSFKGLNTAFGNFLESIGERLAPAVTSVVVSLTNFFNKLNENKPLLDFIFEVGKIALIVTGVVTALATGGIAVIKLQQAFAVAQAAVTSFGIASKIAVGATGLGLLLVVAAEVYTNWNKIFPVIQGVYQTFVENISRISEALSLILSGAATLDTSKIKKGIDEAKAIIADGFNNIKALGDKSVEEEVNQNEAKLAAAQRTNAEIVESERFKREQIQAENDLLFLSLQEGSTALIDLKKQEVELLKQLQDEKYAADKEALTAHLEEIKSLQAEQAAVDLENQNTFNQEVLAQSSAFQALDAQQQQLFLAQKAKALNDARLTEKTAQTQFVTDQLKSQIEHNNRYLIEQQKFGTAYATINRIIYADQVQGAANSFAQLAQLQQSSNSTLRGIGKAAAIAQIIFQTAVSAMNIYAGFSIIPIVGPALGIAGAAAAIAFGADNISKVLSAQEGGIVPGFNTGGDSVPSMLQAGELVVPTRNFSEVVNAVANQRASESTQASSGVAVAGSSSQSVSVNLEFSGDNAEKFLTARQVEARSLGTLREASA